MTIYDVKRFFSWKDCFYFSRPMSLLLAVIFFALFVSAIVRGRFSYGKVDYDFHEHPVQFVIVVVFILGVSALCFYRFLVEMEFIR